LNNTCNFPYFGNQGEKCASDNDCAPGLGCNAALGKTCDAPKNVGKNCTLGNSDVCYSGAACACASVEASNVTCVDTTYPSGCVNYLRTFNVRKKLWELYANIYVGLCDVKDYSYLG
jgi:hypothetical protein